MARILYAASGDGYGHAVRAHSVGLGLLSRGHEVRFLSSGKGRDYLRRQFDGRVHGVFGLNTVYIEGRAEPLRTVLQNARKALTGLRPSNRAVRELLQTFRPDLVITDFEPFSAFWAMRLGIPYVSLDNQHLLTHCRIDHPPGFARDLLAAYCTIRLYFASARRYLITSFIKAPIRYHPTTLVDPILRPKVYATPVRSGDFLLAYKGAGGSNDGMRAELERFDRVPIRAYGFGVTGRRGHIEHKPIDSDEFVEDLSSCAGVIASAGHSLVGECLHFRKPMLLIPIAQQYEQVLNARSIERMGAGRSVDRLTAAAMDEFLGGLDGFRDSMKDRPPARLEPVLDAIEAELPAIG